MNNKLTTKQLRRTCDPKLFDFSSTKSLKALTEIIGQEKAIHSLNFGIEIQSHGYHIYALGPIGTGKSTTIKKFLEKNAKDKPTPDDWLYINNFEDHDKPRTLRLPTGKGREFRNDMDQLVEELKTEVPKAFEHKEYEQEQEKIEREFQRRSKELFAELEKKADEHGFRLLQTTQGMGAFPVIDGQVASPEELAKFSEEKRTKIEKNQEKLQSEMREALRQVEQLQKKGRKHILELDRRIIGFAVDHLINELKEKYADYKAVINHLVESRAYLMKNVQAFKQIKQMEKMSSQQKMMLASGEETSFDEYRVNLVIDNSKTNGAPLIFEKNPTGPNLVGHIEQQGWFGTLVTNFRMIKSGSLHKALGGYLMLEAYDLLTKPLAWHVLKRALKNREIAIESMHEALGAFVTRTLEPEPIPFDAKVILIGDPYIYYLLYSLDQDFKELFKVKADFDFRMNWDKDSLKQYARFIATICHEEKLKHFTPAAVAKIVEHGARLVSHQQKISTKFGDIVDLVRESSYWATKNKHKLVEADDITQTLNEKIYRSNRIETQIQELIKDGTILIDTADSVVGQINGLSVLSLGDYSFGKPSRITARTYIGNKGVINIDREVNLGGPIHNKGTMILTAYLGGTYALDLPITLSASITFEQLYEGVEGDSATAAELFALLSSLADVPLQQNIAVTGSANQHGEIQAIGGVNEKIEGFFQICKHNGLTGNQGVIIPQANVQHLMLQEEIVAATKRGKFHIYAINTIDEGIEILTGQAAGERKANGAYPAKSVNGAVQQRILELSKKALKPQAPKTIKKAKSTATKRKKKR